MPEDNTVIDPNTKGLPEGVTVGDTGGGNRGDGAPAAPEISNTPPPKKEEVADPAKVEDAKVEDKPKVEDEKTETAVDLPTEYIDYGDANANAVVDILKEAKIPAQEAFMMFKEAADTGDMSKINVSALTEKLGKAKADLVLLGVQTYYATHMAGVKEIIDTVYGEAGGEANYAKVVQWARQKADKDPAFQKQVDKFNQMIDLNSTAAGFAAKELVSLYEKDPGNSSLSKNQMHGDKAATNPDTKGEYISRSDYNVQIKAAYDKNDTHEINRLRNLRKASLSN